MIRNRSVRSVPIKKMKRKNSKKKPKFGTSGLNYEDLPHYLRRAWLKIFSPEDLPKNTCGLVRCVYKLKESCYSPWLYNKLYGFERTHKEWCQLYREYNNAPVILDDKKSNENDDIHNPNPFLKSKQIAMHILRLYHLNNRIHFILLQFIQKRRLAAIHRRIVGEEDLYTISRIPKYSLVVVHDFQTQSTYHFHTQTILRMILASLYYNSYGIAKPCAPKNPYTNLEWTLPQLISIAQQITINMIGIHRIPPNIFLAYHTCRYNLKQFTNMCANELGIHAAVELFKNKTDTDTNAIYRETLEDFADEIGHFMSRSIREMICDRKLSKQLQKRWDTIILAIWIYNNLNMYHGEYRSYEELTDRFIELIDDTRSYLFELRRSQLAHQRTTSGVLRVPMNVHTAASIVLAQTLNVDSVETIPPSLPSLPSQPAPQTQPTEEDNANTL